MCTSKIRWHKFLSVQSVCFSIAPSTTCLSFKKSARAAASSDIGYDLSNDKIDDACNSVLWICTESKDGSSIWQVCSLLRLRSFCFFFISLKPPFVYFNQAVTSDAVLLVSRGDLY